MRFNICVLEGPVYIKVHVDQRKPVLRVCTAFRDGQCCVMESMETLVGTPLTYSLTQQIFVDCLLCVKLIWAIRVDRRSRLSILGPEEGT